MNLSLFNTSNLFEASTNLFSQLGIKLNSNTTEALPVRDLLKHHFREIEIFNAIDKTFFVGIIDSSVFQATGMFDEKYSYKEALHQAQKNYEGLMLFALQLSKHPSRTEISDLTRAFNRISHKMPVGLILKYQNESESVISIALSERFKYQQNWRQGEKAGKVIILRDINTLTTHTGHLHILQDLVKPVAITNYAQLHEHWLQVLDVDILNKKFFKELANWYFWAMDNVRFPDDIKLHVDKKKDDELRKATNLIRLITRIIFIWFIKEKKLVPANLFRKDFLSKTVRDFAKNKKSENYYQAILQNLFFATLNQIMKGRDFAEEHERKNKLDQGVKNLYRYSEKFNISKDEIKSLFKDVPFLNGGLFDCLDKFDEEKLEKGIKEQIFVDGFTRVDNKRASVPDFLFFSEEQEIDLNEIYGTSNKKYKVKGLINLLDSYKFTVAENTPLEEEIALDPELLGRVFENLLANYNPETQATARNKTGSFYTPREEVNYMVDESLYEYLKQKCIGIPNLENRLRVLFIYSENPNPFNEKETKILIKAINNCKMLDPACGSGAFPMGMLLKMVYLLSKLDPDTSLWQAEQEEKIIGDKIKELEKDKNAIDGLSDVAVKDKAKKAVDDRLKEIKDIFESENNFDDYSRKLFLIENCIYGIDIQPIAVQIAKLRFFISLIVDQNKQVGKDNFGIRSLPNLETKFVAANTLLGLEIPTNDLFLENNPIKPLQDELKNIRHHYFNAKSREEKIKFQKQDKKLRKAMSEKIKSLLVKQNEEVIIKIQTDIDKAKLVLQKIEQEPEKIEIIETTNLFGEKEHKKINKKQVKLNAQNEIIKQLEYKLKSKQNGLNKEVILQVAENIASFDLYDQNHFANWFEPEWMFGKDVEDGFDIIIGNPPYVNVEEIDESIKKNIYRFKTAYQKYDLYVLFYEKGIDLLKPHGQLNYITSNKFLSQGYGLMLRKEFLKYFIHQIINFNYDIFEAATVRTCIFHLQKSLNSTNEKIKIIDIESSKDSEKFQKLQYKYLDQKIFKETDENNFRINLTNEKIEVLNKIIRNCIRIDDAFSVNYGLRPSSEKLNLKKEAFIYSSNPTKKYKKYFEGKDMGYWLIKSYSYLDYQPEIMYNSMFPELFETEKLVGLRTLSDITKLRFIYDNDKYYCNDSVVVLTLWHLFSKVRNQTIERNISNEKIEISKKFNYLFVQAILNSKLIKFYVNELLYDGTHFYPNHMKSLPIKKADFKSQQPFIELIEKIHSRLEVNQESKIIELVRKLDIMVYKLYELTYDEVLKVDKDFETQMSCMEYEKLDYGFEYFEMSKGSEKQSNESGLTKRRGKNPANIILKSLNFD